MNRLARKNLEHVSAHVADAHHTRRDIWRCLQDPDHVANRIISVGAQQEICPSEEIEVQNMLFHIGNAVAEFAQLLACRRRLHSKYRVASLGRREVMRPRAYS